MTRFGVILLLGLGFAVTTLAEEKADTSQGLGRVEAEALRSEVFAELREKRMAAAKAELKKREVKIGGKRLRWLEKETESFPEDGPSLWISMHGGGGAPSEVNDRQWLNQIRLYQPEEGIYVAPRAPTDTWDLWHQKHIDPMFARLIENFVIARGVNPERVYLMGYSAGGDGVWQVAPRMADRFAAASMMAGHPNEASLLGLRNLPFAIFMGGDDHHFDRNRIAAEKTSELGKLRKDDPGGYRHFSRIYEGTGHWMNGRDAEALPWMAKHTRVSWPKRVVWYQDDVTHDRFYWLQLPSGAAKQGQTIKAEIKGQQISLSGDVPEGLKLLLADELLDLDQPIVVTVNGEEQKPVTVTRTEAVIREFLEERLDPAAVPTAVLMVGGG
ncbi:MAG: dienelactone hydrolase family protein [Verrucomicrobiota bacterium]